MVNRPPPPKLLVIDDDPPSRRLVSAVFSARGFHVVDAADGSVGVEKVSAEAPDVVLLDVRMPGMSGFEVLEQIKARSPLLPVVMLTGSRDLKSAVRSMQLGAADYVTKPVDAEELAVVVRRSMDTSAMRHELQSLRERVLHAQEDSLIQLMGPGPEIAALAEQVKLVAPSTFTVVVIGETGSGKELVARAIHQLSERSRGPFVALDCGAIPEQLMESELFGHERGAFTGADRRKAGRFRLAEGGTCFLDEVGNLPATLQPKLLRVLESRQLTAVGAEHAQPMDVRFVAATNEDLQTRVYQDRFRSDLYFRLAQYTIRVPPLRERRGDIAHLTQRFVREISVELRKPIEAVPPATMAILEARDWPGNVRELQNVLRKAVLHARDLAVRPEDVIAGLNDGGVGRTVAAADLQDRSLRDIAAEAQRSAERQAISAALEAVGGNKSQAARLLRTDYKTLHVKMKQLGVSARDFERP